MYLGLDLRGGAFPAPGRHAGRDHQAPGKHRRPSPAAAREERHGGVTREGQTLRVRFRDAQQRERARGDRREPARPRGDRARDGQDLLVGTLKPEAVKRNQEYALKQNITTLHNRTTSSAAEPVIQQQGAERIVVQLPGVRRDAPSA